MQFTIEYIIFGTLGGLLAWPCSILSGFHPQKRIDNWIRYFFTLGKFGTEDQILRRAKFMAEPPWLLLLVSQLPAFLGLVLSALPLIFWKNPPSIPMFIGVYAMLSAPSLPRGAEFTTLASAFPF